MKTNDFILKRVLFTFFTVLLVSVFSCSTEDDDEDIPDGPTELTFQIDLVKMYATDIKDGEGGRLEVAGNIRATLRSNTDVSIESTTLWTKSASNADFVTFEDFPLGARATVKVLTDYKEYSYFEMYGRMTEVDIAIGNLDEAMGEISSVIDLLAITDTEEFIFEFKESGGQHVEAIYTIKRL